MNEPQPPAGDTNIRVRCVNCATHYTTSRTAFNSFSCKCPVCHSKKAQALE